MSRLTLVALLLAVSAVIAGPAQAHSDRPSRVVLILLDQARPDTIERYDMDNVKALQRRGASFPNALVGHMAAETVISHSVLTSGLFPKNMGWSNEVHRDVDGVLGTPGDYYVTSSLLCSQFQALTEAGQYRRLFADYLDDEFGWPASKFVSIAQKRTAACPAGHTSSVADGDVTDPEDFIFQIRGSSSPIACDPTYKPSSWRQPEFVSGNPRAGLPRPGTALLGAGRPGRRRARTARRASSPGAIYPLEGDRFVPGRDNLRVGGDNWSADAAIRVIESRSGLARDDGEPRGDRQDGPHVGARGRGDWAARLGPIDLPPPLRGEERGRPGGGASSTRSRKQGHPRRDLDRRDRRPRRPDRPSLPGSPRRAILERHPLRPG